MSAHTEGPWQKVEHPDGRFRIDGPYPPGKFVADLPRNYGTLEERRANADLMTAAPDLRQAADFALSTLESLDPHGERDGQTPQAKELLEQALAKAEGGAVEA